jgi:hypothetical protein
MINVNRIGVINVGFQSTAIPTSESEMKIISRLGFAYYT